MTSPTVTVIVPNYNHAPHLAQRLDSILNQTFQDFELIYLDDASTDNSDQVFARYADDARIQAHLNAENTGSPSVQWNKGVNLARGKYVWIAEADDFADPEFLEVLVDRLDRNPAVGLVYCQSWETDGESRDLRTYAFHTDQLDTERWKSDFVANGREECELYLNKINTLPNASAVLVRRDLYLAAGGADESLSYCADWLLWVHILMRSDVAFVAEPLNHYRRHEGAFSNDKKLDIARGTHEMRIKLADAFPEIGHPEHAPKTLALSNHFYGMGRVALRYGDVKNARSLFLTSLRQHPNVMALMFYGVSFLGPRIYTVLDGAKSRLLRG